MSIKISKCKENCSICENSLDRETYNIENKVNMCNECTRSLIKYYNDHALNSILYKYTLSLQMDTDDDCTIYYKGNQYCFYGEDLDVRLEGDTIKEILSKLSEIQVEDGGKASEFTIEWLQGLGEAIQNGTYDEYVGVNGNQIYDFHFYENF
jgi:hypothetical protein